MMEIIQCLIQSVVPLLAHPRDNPSDRHFFDQPIGHLIEAESGNGKTTVLKSFQQNLQTLNVSSTYIDIRACMFHTR